eukprot:TRINITY_DN3229_c0_g1_i1.p1 TRINITY_DN3229_c0_g1~~TRINITY_DN3229_c0_g1_i1.p1  ORF type:complete len:517 (+),score=112.37 TRINITY_DN3229_c0_g1_i1:109-1551(+)
MTDQDSAFEIPSDPVALRELTVQLLAENRLLKKSSGVTGDSTSHSSSDHGDTDRAALIGRVNDLERQLSSALVKAPTSSDYYFDSYAHFSIHEEMIKDGIRTGAYQRAIEQSPAVFKNAVVLDVGAGSGILSLFAARAGARLVVGVECSGVCDVAREVVAANDLSERVLLVKRKMEDLPRLPTTPEEALALSSPDSTKAEEGTAAVTGDIAEGTAVGKATLGPLADVIVSEWMGYGLLYESMLPSVIAARDRFLRPGGTLFPSHARIMVCAIEDSAYKFEKITWWRDVYGFDFRPFRRLALVEPLVDVCPQQNICSTTAVAVDFDLATTTSADLEATFPFEMVMDRTDTIHALLLWFDTSFCGASVPVTIATGPRDTPTHWKQTVFYLHRPIQRTKGAVLRGTVCMKPNRANSRDLDVTLTLSAPGKRQPPTVIDGNARRPARRRRQGAAQKADSGEETEEEPPLDAEDTVELTQEYRLR